MRFATGPLDWLAGGSLHTRTQIITSDFEHFMEEADLELRERDSEHGMEFPHDYYYNKTNGLKHYHDFKKGLPLSETYPAVREKYNRRIARFQRDLSTRKTLLIWFSIGQSHNDEEVLCCCEQVLHKYEGNRHNIHFLIIESGYPPPQTQTTKHQYNTIQYRYSGRIPKRLQRDNGEYSADLSHLHQLCSPEFPLTHAPAKNQTVRHPRAHSPYSYKKMA